MEIEDLLEKIEPFILLVLDEEATTEEMAEIYNTLTIEMSKT